MNLIYEDEECVAYLHATPASPGHVVITPKEKYTVIEELPELLCGHLFVVANRMAGVLFETLGAHGTNLLIQNGTAAGQKEAQVQLHVIPRKENDGLNFLWKPTEDKEKAEVAMIKLNECSTKIVLKDDKKKEVMSDVQEQSETPTNTKWIEDALLRIP